MSGLFSLADPLPGHFSTQRFFFLIANSVTGVVSFTLFVFHWNLGLLEEEGVEAPCLLEPRPKGGPSLGTAGHSLTAFCGVCGFSEEVWCSLLRPTSMSKVCCRCSQLVVQRQDSRVQRKWSGWTPEDILSWCLLLAKRHVIGGAEWLSPLRWSIEGAGRPQWLQGVF